MIYPDTNLEEWLNKYELEITNKICPKCEQNFPTCVPVLIKGYAGLETPEHNCGPNYKAAIFTPTSTEKITFWKNII